MNYADVNNNGVVAANEILEENHYYPYGLKHAGYGVSASVANDGHKYRYNSREYHDELDLNMTAMDFRLYDNILGRFFGMDALSEKNHYLSTYQFGDGNPVVFADPTGLDSEWGYDPKDVWGKHGAGAWLNKYHPSHQNASIDVGNSGGGGGGSTSIDSWEALQYFCILLGNNENVSKVSFSKNRDGSYSVEWWESYSVGATYFPSMNGPLDENGGLIAEFQGSEIVFQRRTATIGRANAGIGNNWFNSFGKFMEEHFFLEAESQITHGLQVAGIVYKGIGIDASIFHQVLWEGRIGTGGNYSNSYKLKKYPKDYEKGKLLDFAAAKILGGGIGFNIENGKVVSTSLSVGYAGWGFDWTFDSNGLINTFVGFQAGGKLAAIWGVSASGKIGLNFDH